MFGVNKLQKIAKTFSVSLIAGFLVLSLWSCGDRTPEGGDVRAATPTDRGTSAAQLAGNISEVSPPAVIQQLRQSLEVYQPQVKILNPQPDEVLQDDTVSVQFQVQDVPIFKNSELDMGPHLHVILDNQPYMAVYDVNQPLVLSDLAPGTHTLRVFASRPWHESFKNEGAYAQTTFHIFTKTDDNNPDLAQPLLTYSRPKGSYGSEPILLDFYLTNAPLHLVARENPNDEIADWRIRCTINGSSFAIDRWEPIYLTGFKPGKNWVQLEFIDEQGNPVKNVFNNTVRVITYEPQGKDTLSKLVRGELSADAARAIVEPSYTTTAPEAAPTPTSTPEPLIPAPSVEETPATLEPSEEIAPEAELEPKDTIETTPEKQEQLDTAKPNGFFNRFGRPSATPSPTLAPEIPPKITTPQPEAVPELQPSPAPETTPDVTTPQPEVVPEPQPLVEPEEQTLEEEPTPLATPNSQLFKLPAQQPKINGYFNRFRRPQATPPGTPPTLPEISEPEASPTPENSEQAELVPDVESNQSAE